MGKSFYVSGFKGEDRWVEDELEVRQHGGVVREGAMEAQKTGKFRRTSALGFDSDQMHYAGDRVVTRGEVVESNGDVTYYFERIGDDGKSRGTYQQPWRKEGEGRLVQGGPARRTFSF